MLFGKQKAKEQIKQNQFQTLAEYNFMTTEHFRGFKKVNFVVHGYTELEENNRSLKDKDFRKQPIRFIKIKSEKGIFLQVYMFDRQLGFSSNDDLIKAFDDLRIDQVYVNYDNERIHLLVHYKD